MKNKNIVDLKDNYLGLRLSDGAGLYVGALVLLYIVQVIVLIIANVMNITSDNIYMQYGIMVINQIVFFGTPMIYGKIFARQMLEPSRIKRGINYKQGLLLPLITVAVILIGLPLSNTFTKLLEMAGYNYMPGIPVATIEQWWTLPLSLLFIAVAPAIGEEFLFRGSIGRSMKSKSYCFAMIFSSLMFALFHGNAIQLVHQFIMGMVACYCYFVTGSLLSSMIIHFSNNAIAITIGFIESSTKSISLSVGATAGIYVAMAIVGVLLLLLLLRTLTRESKKRAGISVGAVDIKGYFVDILNAFYPKGMVMNYRKLNNTMKTLYNDPIDNQAIDTASTVSEQKNYDDIKDEELKKAIKAADKLVEAKRRRTDRTAICIAIALAAIILIINLASNFTAV